MAAKKTAKKVDAGIPAEAIEQVAVKEEFSVSDPLELRPKELELIIKPTSGSWKNEAQAEFAATLNGYAYKNPTKWATKKDVLLKQLTELGGNPELIVALRGNTTKVSYSNENMKNVLN